MKLLAAAVATMALVSVAHAEQTAPKAGNANNTLAAERAVRNSATGDRNPNNSDTTFGQEQSSFVKSLDQPYGQYLKENGWTGTANAPGQQDTSPNQ